MNILPPSESPPSQGKAASGNLLPRFWRALYRWFLDNTFAPAWLGKRWGHPLVGFMAAIFLQIIAMSLRQLLVQFFPQAGFYNALSFLSVAIIALSWGVGPSIVSTLFGAILLVVVVLPSQLSGPPSVKDLVVSALVYLLAGFAISALASQTERARRTAQTLAASLEQERARLETVLEAIPDAVSLHDGQGRSVWLNHKARQVLGSLPTAWTAQAMAQTYPMHAPDGSALPPEQWPVTRALKGETIEEMEVRFQGRLDQERPFIVSAVPLFDTQRQVESVLTIAHDISLRKQAEGEAARRADELEATNNLLTAIIEAITDGVFIYDLEGHTLKINSAGRAFLKRYAPADDASQPAQARATQIIAYDERGHPFPPEDYPSVRVLRGEVLSGANSVDMVIPTVDGGTLQLNLSGAPIKDARGQQSGAVVVARDVTERRRLERRALEALEALLLMARTLVEIPDVSPTEDAAGPLAHNEAAQRLVELTRRVLGCQRASIAAIEPETELHRPIAAGGLSPEEEAFWWREQPQRHLGIEVDPTFATRLRAGEVVIVNMMEPPYQGLSNPYNIQTVLAAPIRIGERLVGILALDYASTPHTFTRDEIALAGAVSQLGALVLERERLLRERAEAQARALALQETNERMDEFLSIVSHELRTPVTSIKTGVQLMLKRLAGPASDTQTVPDARLKLLQDQQRSLQRTDLQIWRLTHLLDDLIDLSRIRLGKLEIQAERCDLGTLVREAVEGEQVTHPDRVIALEQASDAPIYVLVDPNRIGQVLTNYLTNALKYSSADQPVRVGLDVEGQKARVWVRDQGTGIPPKEQAHIWDLFHRVPGIEVQSGSGIGLGLGLHISKTMIEQHHGTVGVESNAGQGSTFWFTLPLADTAPPAGKER
ncbi:MAG TPA: ATP-binding protein [Ktedonobacterales bacterium]|nr:ATP-binding protein [Ktedonobacterales bacterium]